MTRRTFNSILGGGAMGVATGAWPKAAPLANPQSGEAGSHPIKWPSGAYRRLLVDTHVPDWDPHLLANFDGAQYVRLIADAGFQSVMHYAKGHAGLCMWQSKIGHLHANLHGRDFFGEVMKECRRRGMPTVCYYSVLFDMWSLNHIPAWRIVPENGDDQSWKAVLAWFA